MLRPKARSPAGRRAATWRAGTLPLQKPLYRGLDHGAPVLLRAEHFAPPGRQAGWGAFAEQFLRANEMTLASMDVKAELSAVGGETKIRLLPGGRAGAVPLRSAQTHQVKAGLVVRPRFGWSGVGSVMQQTGWAASPQFLDVPLVPGSARDVPPWVLAGPVLARLADLLRSLVPGYEIRRDTLTRPRGRILWSDYVRRSLSTGKWHHLPCQFPDLAKDRVLRSAIRWTLERTRLSLLGAGERDPIATSLGHELALLLQGLQDVIAKEPRTGDLERRFGQRMSHTAQLRLGLQAIGWIVDERGLGGGREMDGLAWQLPLDVLWESHVEAVVRAEEALRGGDVRCGRLHQTVIPLDWSDPSYRSLGHLVPDIVVRRGNAIQVIDAKYKAHFAELDENAWYEFAIDARESHRADIHQVLAYASLFDASEITATLVYPLRVDTWTKLQARGRDSVVAEIFHGGRTIRLKLRGLPFGRSILRSIES
jgi:McrBC 5-methylcytosine restriction system component